MGIRDRDERLRTTAGRPGHADAPAVHFGQAAEEVERPDAAVSYTHLRAHETVLDLVCRLLLEKKNEPNRCPVRSIYHHVLPIHLHYISYICFVSSC